MGYLFCVCRDFNQIDYCFYNDSNMVRISTTTRFFLLFFSLLFLIFYHLGKLTDVFEGSIVRVIRRLEELLRQLATAATAIGNIELKKLFEDGATKIRRGVVFAASLYL